MDRINTPDKRFHNGDPFNGVQGTVVTAEWLNAVQEEIVSVIAAAGIALDGAHSDQLLTAIKVASAGVSNSSVSIAVTGGTTMLNAVEYGSAFIVVTGALTANASLIFPAAIGKWTVINATTGPYTLGCYASNGGGVLVSQGTVDGIVCDGTNIFYQMGDAATQKAVQSNSLTYAQGSNTANAHTASFTPAVTSLSDGMVLTFQASASNAGPCTFAPDGLPPSPIVGGAHQPLQGGEIVSGGRLAVMWHAGLASWVLLCCTGGAVQVGQGTGSGQATTYAQVNALINSAVAALAATVGVGYVNAARTLTAGTYLVNTAASTFTLNLPAAPATGTTLTFIDATAYWATRNWTLGRNGKTIMGQAADLTIDVKDAQFSIWYNGSDWRLV